MTNSDLGVIQFFENWVRTVLPEIEYYKLAIVPENQKLSTKKGYKVRKGKYNKIPNIESVLIMRQL